MEIKVNLLQKWFDSYPNIPIINAYGMTEVSDDVTHYFIPEDSIYNSKIPIGKAIQNMTIYIVDKNMNLCRNIEDFARAEVFAVDYNKTYDRPLIAIRNSNGDEILIDNCKSYVRKYSGKKPQSKHLFPRIKS